MEKGIEKYVSNFDRYFSAGKSAVAVASLVAILTSTSCAFIPKTPKKAAEEVLQMTYRLATLPISYLSKDEPPINRCIEDLREKVCKLYLEEETDFGTEKYFIVLEMKKGIFKDEHRLILGYFDGDNYDFDGTKKLSVVIYTGENPKNFIDPVYGKQDFGYEEFREYFRKPRANTLDVSDNQLEKLKRNNFINAIQFEVFRKDLHERIGIGVKLADEQLHKN